MSLSQRAVEVLGCLHELQGARIAAEDSATAGRDDDVGEDRLLADGAFQYVLHFLDVEETLGQIAHFFLLSSMPLTTSSSFCADTVCSALSAASDASLTLREEARQRVTSVKRASRSSLFLTA